MRVRQCGPYTPAMKPDPAYVMGRSEEETRRLEQRAAFFYPLTRHLFEEAGITAGMKVLDIGSGAGDVSFLVAELVGPAGCVLGVDANPAIVEAARARAHVAGLTYVSFTAGRHTGLAVGPRLRCGRGTSRPDVFR